MTTYVDTLQKAKNQFRPFVDGFCHLTADTPEELDDFARRIGAPPEWRHNASVLHYDLTPDIRAVAVANGAVEVSIDRLRREGLARQCLHASTAGNGH